MSYAPDPRGNNKYIIMATFTMIAIFGVMCYFYGYLLKTKGLI